MNSFNIIYSLLLGSELTLCNNIFWLNKYKSNSYLFSVNSNVIFHKLIEVGFLTKDSGNFETNETHYIMELRNIHDLTKFNLGSFFRDISDHSALNELIDAHRERTINKIML